MASRGELLPPAAAPIHIPVLGLCLGAQLIAKAAHAEVTAMPEPEVGWVDVELTDEAADDPLFSGLRTASPPSMALLRVRGAERRPGARAERRCTQAFRLGDIVWGVQFHPEVTRADSRRVGRGKPDEIPGPPEEMLAEFDRQADSWEAFGRRLCGNFIEAAERVAVTAYTATGSSSWRLHSCQDPT